MYRAVLRAVRNCRLRSGAHVLAAIALGARSFNDVRLATGLSTSTTAAALHSLADLGLIEHDGQAWLIRPGAFEEEKLWTTSNSEAPCPVDESCPESCMTTSNFEATQPDSVPKFETLHTPSTILDPELTAIAQEIRRLAPNFNPKPEISIEDYLTRWEDRRHRMRQHLNYLANPANLAKVRNVSAWLRSGIEKNWAPIRSLDRNQDVAQPKRERA